MDENKGMQTIGSIVTWLIMMVSAVIVGGWSLSIMWEWFVAEQFGIMSLSIPQAAGIMQLIALIRPKSAKVEEDETGIGGMLIMVLKSVLLTLATVGIGWIIHLFV